MLMMLEMAMTIVAKTMNCITMIMVWYIFNACVITNRFIFDAIIIKLLSLNIGLEIKHFAVNLLKALLQCLQMFRFLLQSFSTVSFKSKSEKKSELDLCM